MILLYLLTTHSPNDYCLAWVEIVPIRILQDSTYVLKIRLKARILRVGF